MRRIYLGLMSFWLLSLSTLGFSYNWGNLDEMNEILSNMLKPQQRLTGDTTGLEYYKSYVDRLRVISNEVNRALLDKSRGDYSAAEAALAGACFKLNSLKNDINYDLNNKYMSPTLREQTQNLLGDVGTVIDGIGCSAQGGSSTPWPTTWPTQPTWPTTWPTPTPTWPGMPSPVPPPPTVNPGSSSPVSVIAPFSISAYGGFEVTIFSDLSRSVSAELYLKEEGGNWTSHAEQRFTLHPGQNHQTVNIHTFPGAGKSYRIELRFIENNYSKEMFAQRVSIEY